MRYLKIALLLIFSLSALHSYDEVSFWNRTKSSERGKMLLYKNGKFNLDGREFNIDNLSHITLNLEELATSKNSRFKQTDSKELLRRALELEKLYQDEHATLTLADESLLRLNKEGTHYSFTRYAYKIMKESELENNIMSFYVEKGQREITAINVRVIDEDGSIRYLDSTGIKLSVPRQGTRFYNSNKDARVMTVQLPELKVGSIVDYEYELLEYPEKPELLETSWFFQGNSPVYDSLLEVELPAERKLYWTVKNMPQGLNPQIKELGEGYKKYSFAHSMAAPYEVEPQSPPSGSGKMFIKLSTYPDQTELSKWYTELLKERMVADKAIEEHVKELTKELSNKEDKIAVLYRFVQEKIEYRSIKTSLSSGYAGHPAKETFHNRYGDCIDKAVLYSTMLSLVDVESYPVIVMTKTQTPAYYNEVGTMSGNHAITEIHLDGKIFYLDTTSSTYRYPAFRWDDQGIPAWNAFKNRVRNTGFIEPDVNKVDITGSFHFREEGGGMLKHKLIFSGQSEADARHIIQYGGDWKSLLYANILDDYPGSQFSRWYHYNLENYNTNYEINLEYNISQTSMRVGNMFIINLPKRVKFIDNITLKERKTALVHSNTYSEEQKLTIYIPEGYSLKSAPAPLKIESKHIKFEGEYSQQGDRAYYKHSVTLPTGAIPPEDYLEYRKLVLQIEQFLKSPIIIE